MEESYRNSPITRRVTITMCIITMIALLFTISINTALPPTAFETSQIFYLVIAACVPTIAALILLILNPKPRLRLNIIDAAVLLMTFYMIASVVFSGLPQNMLLAKIVILFSIYVSLRITIATEKRCVDIIVLALLLLGIYQCALSLMQIFGNTISNNGLFLVTGSFHNPGPLGGFLSMIWGVALFQALRHQNNGWWQKTIRAISITFLFLALIILPITQSRTAWIAAMVTSMSVVLALYSQQIRQWIVGRKALSLLFTSISVVLIVGGGLMMYGMKKNSADGRILMWKTTTNMIADHPVCGVGLGLYGGHVGDYQIEYFKSKQRSEQEILIAGSSGSTFNDYLQCAAVMGLIGLAGMLSIGALSFLGLKKGHSGLQFALISLAVFAFASYPLSLLSFGLIGVIILAVGGSEWQWRSVTANRWSTYIILALVFIINIGTIVTVYPHKQHYMAWDDAQFLFRNGSYDAVYEDYAQLATELDYEPQFLYEYAKVLNHKKLPLQSLQKISCAQHYFSDPMMYNLAGNNYKLMGMYDDAEESYFNAYNMVPNRIYPLYLLAQLYKETNQTAKLKQMAQRVLDFKEKVPSTAVDEMKNNTRKFIEDEKIHTSTHMSTARRLMWELSLRECPTQIR